MRGIDAPVRLAKPRRLTLSRHDAAPRGHGAARGPHRWWTGVSLYAGVTKRRLSPHRWSACCHRETGSGARVAESRGLDRRRGRYRSTNGKWPSLSWSSLGESWHKTAYRRIFYPILRLGDCRQSVSAAPNLAILLAAAEHTPRPRLGRNSSRRQRDRSGLDRTPVVEIRRTRRWPTCSPP